MLKIKLIREQDYWLYPIVLMNVIFGTFAIYASVLTFRIPALILFSLGLWFTSNKMRRDYSPKRAHVHIIITLMLVVLLTWFVIELTN